jgi:cytochrome o ubiquinol oxidase subunit 2
MKKYKVALIILLSLGALFWCAMLLKGINVAVMNPKGLIASKQRDLIITATLLMLIVVIPVFLLTIFISWKYRSGNKEAKYSPDWDHNSKAEMVWWGFPLVIILVLSIVTWKWTHDLDPFKPIQSNAKPMTVQVIALRWKWLFIYPEQGIASVNFVQFPEQVPIKFEITSDAPMNSFWIPQLGGQIYAMPGMMSQLNLIADEQGIFSGSSANLSGKGFAGMRFIAKASSQAEFDKWVVSVQGSSQSLNREEYKRLAEPSEYNQAAFYLLQDDGLFNWSIMKYTMPTEVR